MNRFPQSYENFPISSVLGTSGTLPGVYRIKIHPTANGVAHAARRQPTALMPMISEALNKMLENGFITPVEEATEWVSSMVVAVRNGKLRICLILEIPTRPLNVNIIP